MCDNKDINTDEVAYFGASYFEDLDSLKFWCTNVIVLLYPIPRRPVSERELLCLKVPKASSSCPFGKDTMQAKMEH